MQAAIDCVAVATSGAAVCQVHGIVGFTDASLPIVVFVPRQHLHLWLRRYHQLP